MGIGRSMPVVLPLHAPDHRYMITTYELPGRCMIVFMEGVCTLAECRNFAGECDAVGLVRSREFFENNVSVISMGFTIMGEKPRIIDYFFEKFNPPPWCQFTDQYTFQVSKVVLEKYTKWTSCPIHRS